MKSVGLFLIMVTLICTCTACDKCCQSQKKAAQLAEIPVPCSSSDWVKRGVVLAQTEPWEQYYIQNFSSPAEPLAEGRWRIWFCGGDPMTVAFAEGIPGVKMIKQPAVLSTGEPEDAPLAIGNLPEGWRPTQPVHIKLKDGRDRLYFWAHCPSKGIVRYLAADSTDGRRYRVVDPCRPCLYHPHDRAVEFVGTTSAGLKLPFRGKKSIVRPEHEPAALPELICNDATTVYQLPDGTFELYTATPLTVEETDYRWSYSDPGFIRVIDRLISKDGLNWTGRQRVLEPDANDPRDLQFYYLAVTYTPKGRVGMLGHYRERDQTMDIEWCFSKDGISWVRPYRRPWLERGWPERDIDSFGIYSSASIVFHNDKWWLFYSANNDSHNEKLFHGKKRQSAVMLAEAKSIWADKSIGN